MPKNWLDELMSELINKPLDYVEYRLHACDLMTYVRESRTESNAAPSSIKPNEQRIQLFANRDNIVTNYIVG